MIARTLVPIVLLSALAAAPLRAQPAGLKAQIEHFVGAHEQAIVGELIELVSIPNVAGDTENIQRNARFLRGMLAKRGFRAELLETDENPLVYGEMRVDGAKRTILLYAHYDGQPVDPKGWKQNDPFMPVLRAGRLEDRARNVRLSNSNRKERLDPNWRLYGRSASDDKGSIVALCAALDALKSAGLAPTANLRVLLDGELESGSPSLRAAFSRYRDKLAADLVLFLDGPVHPSNRPTLVFGTRGFLSLEVAVYGPRIPVHSGHYGNWVPNPGFRLARLLASMKDESGEVLIKGFYDGIAPLTAEEQAMLDAVPDDPQQLLKVFGLAEAERKGLTLQQALQLPSLNLRGLSSGYVGPEARTIIPDRAVAALDVRLVKETPAAVIAEKIRAHIRAQGFHIVESEPDDATRARHPQIAKLVWRGGTDAYRTSPLLPESRLVAGALEQVFGARPVQIRTGGGAAPIAPFVEAMGYPAAIGVPIANFDDNRHAENENLRLGHLFTGIITIAAVLVM